MASLASIALTAELETVILLVAQPKIKRAIQPQRPPHNPGQSQGGGLTTTSSAQLPAIIADCVVQEKHEDDMVITEHPVEQGATVADHAYKIPARLELTYAWAPASQQNTDGQAPAAFLSGIYQNLLGLQAGRALLSVITGKRSYSNMLIEGLSVTTDKETENVLLIVVSLREIFLVTTQVTSAQLPPDPSAHQFPEQTLPSANRGSVSLQPGTDFNGSLYPGGGTNIP